ncbi:hypothetical protein TUBRATIS_31050 [Tubulinosema ratisbonensis]|uniref:Uncharacterized protein n=1 Tax=Tubulinosema ratisbonensis TaxID=291195 RepID=A0A437AH38_9MICR|nr:hypothetical protein TUBRATIS_31050 [Tubulinosema ratisbonensis]
MHQNEETKNISAIAEKEAKSILNELNLQEEKLIEIQKIGGEGKGLLFINHKLIESAKKGIGAKVLVCTVLVIFIIFIGLFIKIKYY